MKFDLIWKDTDEIISQFDFGFLQNKSVLVTGASGLLGGYFVSTIRSLILKQKMSIKLSAVTHSTPGNYLKALCDFEGAQILSLDLSKPEEVRKLPTTFDVIIHAAGYGQPGKFLLNPVKTISINTASTFELFEKLNPGGKFLFISTSEVYVG